jgi:hypothetical protein
MSRSIEIDFAGVKDSIVVFLKMKKSFPVVCTIFLLYFSFSLTEIVFFFESMKSSSISNNSPLIHFQG